ncbi:hypothetical protein E8E15_002790 [Penicillium rubens]|jgi:hypothetical protein|uniref:Uncharacterized protein n=1 Tax=Penicillium chrysogenum TaxID=5076 RepID=A0A167Q7B9_PENCH|nr:uncharacterized protein N7525_002418 [Penicillium rubens]KAF3020734.1 hypothetical protein E8E15_002790 [Penicillium rubens]KAJ5033702.1 hypothetical protein NUH16_005118 [Penicillium rubens]KAJ5844677.1 hypothetical protein N7525_002418 [Penicillium rubens]KZN84418.1 hypothetical protein EN45_085560 [Penicillium chrysogenum]
MDGLWNGQFIWDGTAGTINTAPLAPPDVHKVDETVPTEPWDRRFAWDHTRSTTHTASLAPPNVYAMDETVPTGNTSMCLVQKRLDALTEQLGNHELRLDDLETETLPSRDDTFKVPNKRSNHSGLLTQSQNRVAQGANILADIKVIADSRDDRKKIRRWKGIFRDHYSVPWDECQVQNGLARVEAGMLDIFNIRANVRTLAKWRMPKNRPRCRQIQRICDYWIDLWRHDPLISVPSEASRQLWALYDS